MLEIPNLFIGRDSEAINGIIEGLKRGLTTLVGIFNVVRNYAGFRTIRINFARYKYTLIIFTRIISQGS